MRMVHVCIRIRKQFVVHVTMWMGCPAVQLEHEPCRCVGSEVGRACRSRCLGGAKRFFGVRTVLGQRTCRAGDSEVHGIRRGRLMDWRLKFSNAKQMDEWLWLQLHPHKHTFTHTHTHSHSHTQKQIHKHTQVSTDTFTDTDTHSHTRSHAITEE
eukprot:m.381911 g.381911  ORF g.381911 m.381911 type:complete len:155 (+) comp20970_c1_seq19:1660-2124(+)